MSLIQSKITKEQHQHKQFFRFHIHSLLAEQFYPTINKMLTRIGAADIGFPIQSTTSLWRWMRKLGFVYKRTFKVILPLDTPTFMAARARYFATLDELRTSGAQFFGTMKHGPIKIKRGVLFGLMEQQA